MSTFQSDVELVEEKLGFVPQDFLDEITKMVDEQLDNGIEAYKKDLLAIASSKGYKNVTDSVIDEACLKLKEKMKSVYDKNMDKFEMYARRNIFSIPADTSTAVGGGDGSSIDSDLMKARERYMALQSACHKVQGSCDEGDALLKDMRSALFNLRVGSQVLEEYEVQPLYKSFQEMAERSGDLEDLTKKAESVVKDMEKVTGPLRGSSGKEGAEGSKDKGTGIAIGNVAETVSLASAVR